MAHPRKRKFKRIIQIRNRKGKWKPVEFLGFNNGKIRIRFFSGEIINRKNARVRWYKPQRIIKLLRSFKDQDAEERKSDKKKNYKRKKQKRKTLKKKHKTAWKANEKT
jgi:hypothetical protein